MVLEKTLESPLDCKEIQPVSPKWNQSLIFIGRSNADAEAPVLWPPDIKNWLIGKDPDAGKDRRQEEKGTIEDKMVGWHHQLDGHDFEQAPGVGNGRESLACCSPLGHRESDMTERLNWYICIHIHKEDMYYICCAQSLSHDWLFVIPWTAARQASLSITNSQNLSKPMYIESVVPSNHLILCHPLLLLPSIFPSIRVFSN